MSKDSMWRRIWNFFVKFSGNLTGPNFVHERGQAVTSGGLGLGLPGNQRDPTEPAMWRTSVSWAARLHLHRITFESMQYGSFFFCIDVMWAKDHRKCSPISMWGGKILPPVMATDSLIYFPMPSNSVLKQLTWLLLYILNHVFRMNSSSEKATEPCANAILICFCSINHQW
jgi:hypothetical protein